MLNLNQLTPEQRAQLRYHINILGIPCQVDQDGFILPCAAQGREDVMDEKNPAAAHPTHFVVHVEALMRIAIFLFSLRQAAPALAAAAEAHLRLIANQVKIDPDSIPSLILPGGNGSR